MAKDSGLRIRVQPELRDEFVTVRRAQDKVAAQVLREFMRAYVDRHGVAKPKVRRGRIKRQGEEGK
jgi:hypothetical protein